LENIRKLIPPTGAKELATLALSRLENQSKLTPEQLLIGKYLLSVGVDPNERVRVCHSGKSYGLNKETLVPIITGFRATDTDSSTEFALFLLENGLQPTAQIAINMIRGLSQDRYQERIERSRIVMDAYVKHGLLEGGKIDFADILRYLKIESEPAGDAYHSLISELLDKGVLNPDSPLLEASTVDEVKLFLKHGGNPSATNNNGETALHLAVQKPDSIPLVWQLLSHGNRDKFTLQQLESAATLSKDYLVKKMINGVETKSITLVVKDVPLFSKKEIRSSSFYKHAMGMIEQDGVKAYYGLVAESSNPDNNYIYLLFENHSGKWSKPGFTLLGGPPGGDPEFGTSDFLYSPIPSSDIRYPLSFGYQVKTGWVYRLSLEIEQPKPLLQKYLEMHDGGNQSGQDGIYNQIPFQDEMESKMIVKSLGLINDVGYDYDDLTNWACSNSPNVSLTKYHRTGDDIYIYRSDCFTWGGEGSSGKQLFSIFRLNSEGTPIDLYHNKADSNDINQLQDYITDRVLELTDLDLDGCPELSLTINSGVGAGEGVYEIKDGKLEFLIHLDSWEEGEADSASECSVGPPFQDCQGW